MFLHEEDLVLMNFLVHGEFPGLSEGLGAVLVWAFERLLASVDVGVLLQVLGECELLVAYYTGKHL